MKHVRVAFGVPYFFSLVFLFLSVFNFFVLVVGILVLTVDTEITFKVSFLSDELIVTKISL